MTLAVFLAGLLVPMLLGMPVAFAMLVRGVALLPALGQSDTAWSAKPVGYHNEQVLGGLLGLSKTEMEALERKKVIGKWADIPGARPPRQGKKGP